MRKNFLSLLSLLAVLLVGACSTRSSSDAIPVPDDFSSSWYYLHNSELLADYDPNDSLALALHYVEIGQALGLDYRRPGIESSSSGGGLSSGTGNSSSSPLSSWTPGTLPEEFQAQEYCVLNPDLHTSWSISNCTSLTPAQVTLLENHLVNSGMEEGRWWNLDAQCTPREETSAALPCDFDLLTYWKSCRSGEPSCALALTQQAELRAHYLDTGYTSSLRYTCAPADFSATGYCDRNSDLAAVYGPQCADPVLRWHYCLKGRAEGRLYKEPDPEVNPFEDYVPITTEPAFKIIGYVMGGTALTTWNEDYMKRMTHIVVFGPEVSANGSIVWKNADKVMLQYWSYWGSKIDTRVMLAFGGWDKSGGFPEMAASPTARAKFIDELAELHDYFVYGIDIDWEGGAGVSGWNHPGENVNVLLSEMKSRLAPLGMKISIALHATNQMGMTTVGFNAVDWVNVMCYDGGDHATWGKLNSCMAGYAASYKSKSVIGHPFYYPAGASAKSFSQGGTNDVVSLTGVQQAVNTIKNGEFAGFMAWAIEHDHNVGSAAALSGTSLMFKAAETAGYNP